MLLRQPKVLQPSIPLAESWRPVPGIRCEPLPDRQGCGCLHLASTEYNSVVTLLSHSPTHVVSQTAAHQDMGLIDALFTLTTIQKPINVSPISPISPETNFNHSADRPLPSGLVSSVTTSEPHDQPPIDRLTSSEPYARGCFNCASQPAMPCFENIDLVVAKRNLVQV